MSLAAVFGIMIGVFFLTLAVVAYVTRDDE
jgi:hypothetical protein